MKRLLDKFASTGEEYDKIFEKRRAEGISPVDKERWKLLMKYYKEGKLLDVGCLDSEIPELMDSKNYVGIDISPKAINEMRKKYPDAYYHIKSLVDHYDEYDYLIMGEFLEHVEDPKKEVELAFKLLKQGGILAISAPFNETIAGDVDGIHHMWSLDFNDLAEFCSPLATKVENGIITAEPGKPYHHPLMVSFWKKN